MTSRNDSEFLGTAPVGKLLWKLALPTIVAQLINMLYNLVDRVYIGHIPQFGDLALTGVGVCMPIILFVSAFASLVCASGAPRVSIFLGKKDPDSALKTMGSCFSMQILVSLVMTVLLLIWHEDILLAFGASENTIVYASDYMSVYVLGTIFVQMTLGINAYITAQGYARMGMLTVLIGAVCNIILDPVFIFALDLGVKGAAWATIISQGISCVWVVTFLFSKRSALRLSFDAIKIRLRYFMPCLALGLAPFIMQSSESVISICFNSSLLKYGGDIAVGSMTILTSVMQFAMLPLQGLAQGAQPITSYNYGAKNVKRVKDIFRLLLLTSFGYSVALWAIMMIVPRGFAGIFTPDLALLDFTERTLRIYCGALCIFGIQIACQMTFVSLGKAACSVIVAVMRKFILLIPLIYLLPELMADKTIAVYTAEPIADTLSVAFTAVLFFYQFRSAMRKLDPGERSLS